MACLDLSDFRPADYFRTGPYTHFHMDPLAVNQDGDTVVSWTYIYRDLGMDTEISKRFLVRPAQRQGYFWVRTCPEPVPNNCDPQDVTRALEWFGGQWRKKKKIQKILKIIFDIT
jgi:hypothetical protein